MNDVNPASGWYVLPDKNGPILFDIPAKIKVALKLYELAHQGNGYSYSPDVTMVAADVLLQYLKG